MTRSKKWFIITFIVVLIILLFRMKAIAPASILSFILFLAALIEKLLRIQAIRVSINNMNQAFKGAVRPSSVDMSVEEAKELLEVSDNPTKKEIKDAYRNLMQKNHPDKGGTKYLAAKINKAKEVLFKEIK